MNPELKVGMLALIIGCKHPQNSWIIGKTVIIEGLFTIGECVPDQFRSDAAKRTPPERRGAFTTNVAIVSGYNTSPWILENHGVIGQQHLMPLPPLDDDAIIHSTETPKETEKC